MHRQSKITALLLILLAASFGGQQSAIAGERLSPEEVDRIVEKIETAYADAWSKGSVDEVLELFDSEATVESEWGTVLKGHEVLRKWLAQTFENQEIPEARMIRPTVSTSLTPEVIVSHGVTFYAYGTGVTERLFHTHVLLQTGDGWKIAAEQLARPSTIPQTRILAQ